MNVRDLPAALADYQVVLEPDQNVPEWWAGAPSAVEAADGGVYLACRMREGDSPRGLRGYEVRLLHSADGLHFERIGGITREAAGLKGFERPALVRVPETGLYRLYGCTPLERGWAIIRWDDAADPTQIDPATARPVLVSDYPQDSFVHVTGYKDPVVLWAGGRWHMYVIGTDRVERLWHFTGDDGDRWQPVGTGPAMDNGGWHNYFTRPASVVPLPVGWLVIYEGANLGWRDPVYNIATGLAWSPDLDTIVDLTPDQPLLRSTTPGDYHTWRYSHWLPYRGQLYVYFEAARPNSTNEVRVAVVQP